MSTAGRLYDAMFEAIYGYEDSTGYFDPGPGAELDRDVRDKIIDAAVEVAWSFIEAEHRKIRAGGTEEDAR